MRRILNPFIPPGCKDPQYLTIWDWGKFSGTHSPVKWAKLSANLIEFLRQNNFWRQRKHRLYIAETCEISDLIGLAIGSCNTVRRICYDAIRQCKNQKLWENAPKFGYGVQCVPQREILKSGTIPAWSLSKFAIYKMVTAILSDARDACIRHSYPNLQL